MAHQMHLGHERTHQRYVGAIGDGHSDRYVGVVGGCRNLGSATEHSMRCVISCGHRICRYRCGPRCDARCLDDQQLITGDNNDLHCSEQQHTEQRQRQCKLYCCLTAVGSVGAGGSGLSQCDW